MSFQESQTYLGISHSGTRQLGGRNLECLLERADCEGWRGLQCRGSPGSETGEEKTCLVFCCYQGYADGFVNQSSEVFLLGLAKPDPQHWNVSGDQWQKKGDSDHV